MLLIPNRPEPLRVSEIDDGSGSVEERARPGDLERADVPSSAVETDADSAPVGDASPIAASDAFAALGNEVRTSVLGALAESEPRPFSELFEAAPVDTSAGFAYHLRQLDGRFVRKDEDGYRLTHAGRRAARATRTNAYAEQADFDPIDLAEECPLCREARLTASCADGYVTVACGRCDRSILTLPLPPGGEDTPPEALVESLDRHTRSRLSLASEGSCPACAGSVEAGIDSPPDGLAEELAEEDERAGEEERVQAHFACSICGWHLASPVALALLDHPAVVSFYHEHDRDVRERPVWNVGDEWRETVLSTDPWCVQVSTRLDDQVLSLLVGRDLTVVETERHAA